MGILLNHFNIKKDILFKILLILGLLDILQILLVLLICGYLFLIIIELILHYILLYYIVHIFIFGGSSSLLTKYNCWILGFKISKIFAEELETFKNSIRDLYSNNNKKDLSLNELYSKSSTLSSINELIYSYLKLSNSVDEKKISSFQKSIVVCLNRLKMTIEESNLTKIISEATVLYNRNKKFEIKSDNLDKSLDKMIEYIDNILDQIKKFQLKGNFWSNILNFLKNDSFGSLIQLKNELITTYNCEPFKVNIKNSKIKLDCLLIKNNEKNEKNEKEEKEENSENEEKIVRKERKVRKRLTRLIDISQIKGIPEVHFDKEDDINKELKDKDKKEEDKKLIFDEEINTKSKKETKNENIKNIESNKKTAILICNKALYPYELSVYYDRWIEYYLSWGLNIILYNYRGYSESNGFSTISNLQTDAEEVIEYIKNKYNFTNIGVHGINLGGIPASYLCSINKVNFCFVDRAFGSLYEFIQDITFKNINLLLKATFINDSNIVKLLNGSLKRKKNSKNVFKLISYDLKKEFIKHDTSLRTKMAKDFYNKLTKKKNNNEYILKTILDNNDNEYDNFENDIFYILQKVMSNLDEKKDNKLECHSIIESDNFKTNTTISTGNLSDLDSQMSNIDTPYSLEKQLNKEGEKHLELRVIHSLKKIFDKFDAGGETLLSLYKDYETNDSKKNILNNFFVNLLAWGSYKIGNNYASGLYVAYNAIVKKFPYVNSRIEKIIKNPNKYKINDTVLINSLNTVLECLKKIQKFYEDNFLSQKNKDFELIIEEKDNNLDYDNAKNDEGHIEIENSINELIKDNKEKKKIIDLVNEINFGNLFILNCGNEGQFSHQEIQMLSLFLMNSNFVK